MRVVQRVLGEHATAGSDVRFEPTLESPPVAVQPVRTGLRRVVEHLLPEIQRVRTGVGERPRDVGREPDQDARRTRKRHAIDIERIRHHDVDLVPDRRQRHVEMRIAGQQGMAGGRAGAGNGPVVGSMGGSRGRGEPGKRGDISFTGPLRRRQSPLLPHPRLPPLRRDDGLLDRRVHGRQRLGDVRAKGVDQPRPRQIRRVVREGLSHALGKQERVDGHPALRRRPEQAEFERDVGRFQRTDARLHPLGVRENGPPHVGRGVERGPLALGGPPKPDGPRLAVHRQEIRTPLTQTARGRARLGFHLKQAMVRVEISHHPPGIERVAGVDMGYHAIVEDDAHTIRKRRDDDRRRDVGLVSKRPHATHRIEQGSERRQRSERAEPGSQQHREQCGAAATPYPAHQSRGSLRASSASTL